ncbi:MAG: hypothetical protein ABL958_12660 [Bdellovibrionia bacterium]
MRQVWKTLICFSVLMAFYQNCGGVSFSKLSGSGPDQTDSDAPDNDARNGGVDDPNDPGLDGGHFDIDTSSQVYALGSGHTDHHVHEYDDKHNVNYVDFFNLLDAGFTKISSNIGPTESFIIIVANAQLSPGAIIEINGTSYPVVDYQKKVEDFRSGAASALTVFTLNSANSLTSLKLKFKADALKSGGLIPTQTGCVVKNDPGINGEYRNGALIVQILNAANARIDATTKTAVSGLLWESTVFWHKEGAGCY